MKCWVVKVLNTPKPENSCSVDNLAVEIFEGENASVFGWLYLAPLIARRT